MSGLFNLGSGQRNISQDMIPGKDYIIFKDGNDVEYKILNIDNEKYMPKTGIVEFTPFKVAKRNLDELIIKFYPDSKTGLYIGNPMGVDNRTKQVIWQTFKIRGSVTYDLSIPVQRLEAFVLSNSYFVIGSPNFRKGTKTVFKKVDKEREAEDFLKNRRTKKKAEEIAEGLMGSSLYDMAYAIGKDPKFMSPVMLAQEVILYAEKNPVKFLEIFESPGRTALVTLKRGLATGIIDHTVDRGICYEGVPMGFSDEEAVQYLKGNPSVQTSIELQSKKKEDATYASMSNSFQKEAAEIVDAKDVKIAALEEELRKTKIEKERAASVAHELIADKNIAEIDPELAELRQEAKKHNVKGWALPSMTKGKLQEKIDEAKAKLNN
jgi:hypothetical protein